MRLEARKLNIQIASVLLLSSFVVDAGGANAKDIDGPGDEVDATADSSLAMHLHEPVLVDSNLSWTTLINTAYQRFPNFVELTARREEAQALVSAGRRPLSAAPSFSVSYLTDAPLDDLDQREYDIGVALPLWRFGQRAAARDLGDTTSERQAWLPMQCAGKLPDYLRQVLWDVVTAENELALAQTSVRIANETVDIVRRRRESGDLPLADELLAESELFAREMVVIDREAQLLDAERAYRSLTGLDARPASFSEPQTEREELDDSHPLLAFANAQLARARASHALSEESSRGSPSLNIGPHRQRDPLGTFFSNSMQVTFNMPIGGKNYGAATRARAARVVAAADAQRSALLRDLDLQLHEAEHELFVAEQSLDVAVDRAELANRQLTMAQTAFAQGELELRTLLRIQEAALAADSDVAGLRILRLRMIAMFNHALGEIP